MYNNRKLIIPEFIGEKIFNIYLKAKPDNVTLFW